MQEVLCDITCSSQSVCVCLCTNTAGSGFAACWTSAVLQWVDQKVESWARYRSGRDVRELLHPEEPSQHQTSYETEHTLPVTDSSSHRAGGRPTQWHQHNILTGRVNPGHASVQQIIQIKRIYVNISADLSHTSFLGTI